MLKKFYLLMFFLINVFCNESQFNDAEIQEFNKKDCIVFENSKEDKNKLKKSIEYMVSEIIENNLPFRDIRKELSEYISGRIINQTNSILNGGYNLKLQKEMFKNSGFTFS